MEWLLYSFAGGFVGALLSFPLTYVAMRSSYGYKFSDKKAIVLFLLSVPIIGISQIVINPPGSTSEYLEMFSTLIVPFFVSAILIHVVYRKKL